MTTGPSGTRHATGASKRRTSRHGRRTSQWPIIGLAWIAALLLGYAGFALNAAALGRHYSPLDLLYLTLQLIPLNSGMVDQINWELDVARLLLPALAAYTLWQAITALFNEQLAFLRLWRIRDHIVICGLSRKGWLLVAGFLEQGYRVVVVESDEGNDLLEACLDRGAEVIVGDATTPEVLRRAAVPRARHVVAVTADDGINAEIGLCVEALILETAQARHRELPLTCTVHLVDTQLYELARAREMLAQQTPFFRLELFNVFDRGGRLMWEEHKPAAVRTAGALAPTHILLVGLGKLGENLLLHAARERYGMLQGAQATGPAPARLRVIAIDRDADQRCAALIARYPQLSRVCDLVPVRVNVNRPELLQVVQRAYGAANAPIDAVYVCFDNDSLGLRTALALHHGLRPLGQGPVPIVVRMAESGGLAQLLGLGPPASPHAAFANIEVFTLLDHTCSPGMILGGTHEVLAQAIHEDVVRRGMQRDEAIVSPWEELPEDKRRPYYAQADHIGAGVHSLGYDLAPLTDWDAGTFCFTPAEVEHMAQLEHARSVDELHKTGTIRAAWQDLTEEEREKLRASLRALPAFLARVGFQVVKLASPATLVEAAPGAPQGLV